MDISFAFIIHAIITHWAMLASILVLASYRYLARKIPILPRIPIDLLILYLIFLLVLINLPEGAPPKIIKAVTVASAIALNCAVARLVFYVVVESWFVWRKKTKVPKITRDLVLFASYAIIIFVVLRTRGGVNLVGLVTTSAVLTAVIGLAAQNALGNLFASLSIQIEHPFRIGDWIQYREYSGRVSTIGWEATHLVTFEDEMIMIPNLDISKSVIKNYSRPTSRHVMKIDVGIEYGVPPNKVSRVLLDACEQEPSVIKDPKPAIRIVNYGDFAITYQMRIFYDDYGISPDLRAAVMKRVWYALRRNGIRFPFPVRDIHHHHIERRFEADEAGRLRAGAAHEVDAVPIFKPLTAEARALISEQMTIEEYGDGEEIVRQGESGDSLYIIHKGACDVLVSSAGSPRAKVSTLVPPAFFGEMSLLTGEPRSATVRACGDTTVFSIGRDLFRDVLVAQPEVSEELARSLAKRQTDTALVVGKQTEEQERQASRMLTRIKSFFGLKA